jgi:hypothetical protein
MAEKRQVKTVVQRPPGDSLWRIGLDGDDATYYLLADTIDLAIQEMRSFLKVVRSNCRVREVTLLGTVLNSPKF